MLYEDQCPVPPSQVPLNEFNQLKDSWFFSWAIKKNNTLYINLLAAWFISFPFSLVIQNGSWELRHNIIKLILTSIFTSLLVPQFVLIRQLLGWSYVFKKLTSEKIEYEESGWHDGQVWEKPKYWKQKEYLIAQFEVKPVLKLLRITMLIILAVQISNLSIIIII